MELKVPVTQPGQTDWVDVRIDRTDLGAGVVEQTVTIANNSLQILRIQPWLEEKTLVAAPAGIDTESPTGHLSYTFDSAMDVSVTIRLQE